MENPFKPLVKKWYIGKLEYGTPYFWPRNYIPWIIRIRKIKDNKLPMIRRSWSKRIGNYYVELGYPIVYRNIKLGWKDKYETPRFEWSPMKMLFLFKWQIVRIEKAPIEDDKYWEMYLWWKYYCDEDIKIAEHTWLWVDSFTKKSTWDKNALIN